MNNHFLCPVGFEEEAREILASKDFTRLRTLLARAVLCEETIATFGFCLAVLLAQSRVETDHFHIEVDGILLGETLNFIRCAQIALQERATKQAAVESFIGPSFSAMSNYCANDSYWQGVALVRSFMCNHLEDDAKKVNAGFAKHILRRAHDNIMSSCSNIEWGIHPAYLSMIRQGYLHQVSCDEVELPALNMED